MTYYGFVLILVGFSIDTFPCQVTPVFTIYPGHSSSIATRQSVPNGYDSQYGSQPFTRQYTATGFQQVPPQAPNEDELHIQIPDPNEYRGPSQFQYLNGNVVRVTYDNSPQENTKPLEGYFPPVDSPNHYEKQPNVVRQTYFHSREQDSRPYAGNTQSGNLIWEFNSQNQYANGTNPSRIINSSKPQQDRRPIQGYIQSEKDNNNYGNVLLLLMEPQLEKQQINQSPPTGNQLVRLQSPEQIKGNQFQISPPQQGYIILPSGKILPSSLQQRQHPSQYQNDGGQSNNIPTSKVDFIQPYRLTTNQYQSLPNRESDRQQYNSQQLSHPATNEQTYIQAYVQPNVRITPNQYESASNGDRWLNPTHKFEILQGPQAVSNIYSLEAPNVYTIPKPADPNYQTANSPYSHQREYSAQVVNPLTDERRLQPVKQEAYLNGDHLVYQQLSTFGNLQNSSKLTTAHTTKRPFFNRFAADLYITRKPCEVCCKIDELAPCTSCCNATALLNVKTLKTAVG